MDKYKQIKDMLVSVIQGQVGKGLGSVDTKELGEAIDMIKDMEEAIYYCAITKAMEESKEEEKFKEKFYSRYPMMYNDGNRYYNGGGNNGGGNSGNSGSNGGSRNYDGNRMYYHGDNGMNSRSYHGDEYYPYPSEIRDYREGKSPMSRRNYMESKELKHDKAKQMQELDKYAKELMDDVMDMIKDASPEEKQILSQKISTLASKIQ